MTWSPLQADDIPTSHLPFSSATRAGDYLFVSGQASVDATGQVVHGSFEDEMRRSVDNLAKVLTGAHLSLTDVVKVTCYLANPTDLTEYNLIYRELFSQPLPARTTLTGCLASTKFEIDAIAYAPRI